MKNWPIKKILLKKFQKGIKQKALTFCVVGVLNIVDPIAVLQGDICCS